MIILYDYLLGSFFRILLSFSVANFYWIVFFNFDTLKFKIISWDICKKLIAM